MDFHVSKAKRPHPTAAYTRASRLLPESAAEFSHPFNHGITSPAYPPGKLESDAPVLRAPSPRGPDAAQLPKVTGPERIEYARTGSAGTSRADSREPWESPPDATTQLFGVRTSMPVVSMPVVSMAAGCCADFKR